MKKGTFKRPENIAHPGGSVQPKRCKEKHTSLKHTRSEESLLNQSDRGAPRRKASTPTKDLTSRSLSPDISCIKANESVSVPGAMKTQGKPAMSTQNVKKTTMVGVENLKDQLNHQYTRYLQTLFKTGLEKSKLSETQDKLASLRNQVAEHERILLETTNRLKKISFNREVELLHRLHNPDYGKVLESIDRSKYEESLPEMSKKLEQYQNQLETKKIELPPGGGVELMDVITDTLSAFEKLKTDNNVEIRNVVHEINAANKSISEATKRYQEDIPYMDDLLTEKAIVEISGKCIRFRE